ncbi:MAG TPA: DUF177 domain-containing protein [Flavobacteriaceae bacterium]|nr:DUF177 domain-containing protein [Flavobacteriaceae bacterium]
MKKLKEYIIPFVGMKLGKHQFEYKIDNEFFGFFDYEDFNSADVTVRLSLNKKNTMLELDFEAEGSININCDLTNEPFDQKIDGNLSLVVKFGQEYEEVNEELLVLPHGEHEIAVQQYIYEAIVLAVPVKRVHPGVRDGSLESEALKKLEELRPKTAEEKKNTEETDPRWDKLKTLLKDK